MKTYRPIKLFAILLLMAFTSELTAQKIMGLPEEFDKPKDKFENPIELAKYLERTSNPMKKPWAVVSDRDDNPVYAKNDASSEVTTTLNFRDLCYVLDTKGEWIKIATATGVNKLKAIDGRELGWIKKDKMLLWMKGIVDENTLIHRKAFLLNRADDIDMFAKAGNSGDNILKDFYRHPSSGKKEGTRSIYDYYFVFKKEGNMFLLGSEVELTSLGLRGDDLVGWVRESDLQLWNTRISLEPNFSPDAFEERKSNPNLRVRAYGNANALESLSSSSRGSNNAFWEDDPVVFPRSEMSKSDPHRFKGSVIRFPLFKKAARGNLEYFRSGVIGQIKVSSDASGGARFETEIPEHKNAQMLEVVHDMEGRSSNVNVFFMIEATDNTYNSKQDIVNAIRSLKSQEMAGIRNFGALLYNDEVEGNNGIIGYERLAPGMDKVIGLIENTDFSNKIDQDQVTTLNYALSKTVQNAGFTEDAVNILIIMGSGGDLRSDPNRKSKARSENSAAFVSNDKLSELFENLSELKTHIHSIQLYNSGGVATQKFGNHTCGFILESAKSEYNRNSRNESITKLIKQEEDAEYGPPMLDKPNDLRTSVRMEGSKPGRILIPESGKKLMSGQLGDGLISMIKNSLDHEQALLDLIQNTFRKGDEVDIRTMSEESGISLGSLSSGFIQMYQQLFEESGVEEEYILKSTGKKWSLYTEVYLPVRISGAQNNACSYVLFMPEDDLRDYQEILDRNITQALNSGSYPEKRKALFAMYVNLVQTFAAQDIKKSKKTEEFDLAEVQEIIQGVYNEGLELDFPLDVKIGDIQKSKVVKDPEIDQLIERAYNVSSGLKMILRDYLDFDFYFQTNSANRYYWLRLDEVF